VELVGFSARLVVIESVGVCAGWVSAAPQGPPGVEALMTRGATFALRRAGARIAETNAGDAAAIKSAQSRQARLVEATARCAQARPDFALELESPIAPVRATGIEQFAGWVTAQARDGEVAACDRLPRK